MDFSSLGFVLLPDYWENGFYSGQTDTGKSASTEIRRKYGKGDVIFTILDQGQFDIRFGAWFKEDMEEND